MITGFLTALRRYEREHGVRPDLLYLSEPDYRSAVQWMGHSTGFGVLLLIDDTLTRGQVRWAVSEEASCERSGR